MPHFEYKVVPAPISGQKSGAKRTPEAQFAQALQSLMNELASEGWEFQRAESLPSHERSGLTAKTTRMRHVLVFRRAREKDTADEPDAAGAHPLRPPLATPQTPDEDASQSAGARQMLLDNGVEELSDVAGLTNSLQTLASARSKTKSDN